MPIGEFGGAPPLVAEGSPVLTTPMYWMYEMGQASLNPARAITDATKLLFQNPLNPWARTEVGKLPRAERRGDCMFQRNNGDAIERSGHTRFSSELSLRA